MSRFSSSSGPPNPPTPRLRRRLWIGGVCVLLVGALAAALISLRAEEDPTQYVRRARQAAIVGDVPAADRWVARLQSSLPQLGTLEEFRADQESARKLCAALDLPALPDVTGIDEAGQELFFIALQQLRRNPHQPEQYGALGRLYEAQTFPKHADALFRRAIELAPDEAQWHYHLGLLLAKESDLPGASAALKRASELKPDYAPVWMRRAWLAVEQGEFDEASRLIDRYVKLRPSDPFGYVERASLLADQGRWEEARRDLDAARDRGAIGRQGHRLLGRYFAQRKNREESRLHSALSADADMNVMADPIAAASVEFATYRHPVMTRFVALVESRAWSEALEISDQVLAKYAPGSKDHARVCGRLAECHFRLGDLQTAEQFLQRALAVFPNDPPGHALYALIALQTGRLEATVGHAEQALRADPDSLNALHARSMARIGLAASWRARPEQAPADISPRTAVEQARVDIEKCLEREPVNATYLMIHATALGMLDDYAGAGLALEKALRITPNDEFLKMLKSRADAQQSFWFAM